MPTQDIVKKAAITLANADGADWWTTLHPITREGLVDGVNRLISAGMLVGEEATADQILAEITRLVLAIEAANRERPVSNPWILLIEGLRRHYVITTRLTPAADTDNQQQNGAHAHEPEQPVQQETRTDAQKREDQ
jgi:hypothetical protein